MDKSRTVCHGRWATPRRGAALAAVLLLGTTGSAGAQVASRQDGVKLLEQQLAWQGGGGLLAHVRDSTSGWSTPVGTGSGTMPLREDAIIEIASISKVLTGLLLASMVGQGEVTLDQPVAELLPASVHVPIHQGRAITLLDLATATAGLPRLPSNLQPANPADPYADYGAQDLYDFLSGYTLTRAPGATYEYSNLGMGLLGHALALRLGMSYEQAVIERVLHPLGMHDTRITLTPQQAARMVQGHDGELKPVPAWTEGVLAGAYAWRSTLADMRRLAKSFNKESIGRNISCGSSTSTWRP